jgi:hypothetical protein
MTARDELLSRLEYLDAATLLPTMIDQGVVPSIHNGVANLLRKGMGIVAFNILEDFIKKRCAEALENISTSGISFSLLTDSMQRGATMDALSSLVFRARIEKKDGGDWKSLIQSETINIHSTKNPVFNLSPLSFASSGSNVTPDDVKDILAAFGIPNGWGAMKDLSDNISGGVPNLHDAYKFAAERRHQSAHSANFLYDYQWLRNIRNEILAIAASLDILLEARCRKIRSSLNKPVAEHACDIWNVRFLMEHGVSFKEAKSVTGRAIKNWPNLDDAIANIRSKLVHNDEFLVVLDNSRRIRKWYVN